MLGSFTASPRAWALAAILSAAAAAAAAWGYHRATVAELHARMSEQERAYAHEREATHHAAQRQLLHWQLHTARSAHHAQLQNLRGAERRTRAELERLRQSVAASSVDTSPDAPTARAATADPAADAHGPLLGECAQELVELASAAEGHAADVRNLLAHWPAAPDAVPQPEPDQP